MMAEDELTQQVRDAIEKWMQNDGTDAESQDSMDREDALFNALSNLMPTDEEPPRKKSKLPEEATDESSTAKKDQQNHKPRTMKDVAILILDKCADADLVKLIIYTDRGVLENDGDRDYLKKKIAEVNIVGIIFCGKHVSLQDDIDNEYMDLERKFSPVGNLQGALKDIFDSNQSQNKDVMEWDKDFVIPLTEGPPKFNFSDDMTKAHAVVIAGESGSGKSWFAKKWLPSEFPKASFIYHELDDNDANEFEVLAQPNQELAAAYQTAMQSLLRGGHHGDTPVYLAVSELSRQNNCGRNVAAVKFFEKLMRKVMDKKQIALDWWKNPMHTLEELVIIIDEVGKVPQFGRGVVDEVRHICIEICNRKCAKKVLLVLVGSGLDRFIGRDTIDFETSNCDTNERDFYATFGTDPLKSNVTVLKGPNLNNKEKISEIPIKHIMGGTYSQVLATNTRMLTRGVIPIFKSKLNTIRVNNLYSRRVELGSTNVVMDYAARIYIELNGLSRIHGEKFEALLLNQFRLLAHQSRAVCRQKSTSVANPAFELSFPITNKEYEAVLRAGLITADIVGTSKALRYLACKGQTAPLYARDGVGFEIVLQHHLLRLCRAEYEGEDNEYYCDGYSLFQAWPPSSTKKKGLDSPQNVKEEVEARYRNEKHHHCTEDAEQIAKLVEGKCDYDLVLRQTVGNVQGADVLVLSKRKGDQDKANLDLYQAKNYASVPSGRSRETIGAFASLGVLYNPENMSLDTEPKISPAAYSYLGTTKFAAELSKELKIEVAIRKRIVVFSQAWDSFLESRSWKDFNFTVAKEKNVWIWTREMLEPTISALVTEPPLKLSKEGESDPIEW